MREFSAGALYVVATPIGNLNDMTLRALEVLEKVDVIAAEDTRHTKRLLSHFNIKSRLIAYHEHNEEESARGVLHLLQSGASVALVSSAGTPTVSDPGYRLVHTAIAENIRVIPIPGVSAAVTALSASGLPSDRFCFIGFLAARSKKRREQIASLAGVSATLIFYESPNRILATLADMVEIFGDRPAVCARELTKTYEEFLRGELSRIRDDLEARSAIKGEITLLVSGGGDAAPFCFAAVQDQVEEALKSGKTSVSALAKELSAAWGVSKNQLYEKILEVKSSMDTPSRNKQRRD